MRESLPGWVGLLVGALVLLLLPLVLYPVLALEIATWGLFAVALDLLLGFVGVLSFGHAAFWGTGGYAAGILARQFGLAFPWRRSSACWRRWCWRHPLALCRFDVAVSTSRW